MNVEALVPVNGVAIIVNRRGIVQDLIKGKRYEMMAKPRDLLGKPFKILFDDETAAAITGAIKTVLVTGRPFFLKKTRATWGKKWRAYRTWVTKYDKYRCAICGVPIESSDQRETFFKASDQEEKAG